MRKRQVCRQVDFVAGADSHYRRAPLSHSVKREDGRLLKGAREKSTGSVALMVVKEQQWGGRWSGKPLADHPGQMELVLEPKRHGLPEAPEAAGNVIEIRFDQAREFGVRLVIECDVVEITGLQSGRFQAVGDRLGGEGMIVLPPREPLFLGGGDDLSIKHHGRRAIVIESRNGKNRSHDSSCTEESEGRTTYTGAP